MCTFTQALLPNQAGRAGSIGAVPPTNRRDSRSWDRVLRRVRRCRDAQHEPEHHRLSNRVLDYTVVLRILCAALTGRIRKFVRIAQEARKASHLAASRSTKAVRCARIARAAQADSRRPGRYRAAARKPPIERPAPAPRRRPSVRSPTTRLLLLCLQGPRGWLALGGRAPLVERVGLCALSAPSGNPSGASLVTAVRAERGAAVRAAMARRRLTARHDRYVWAEARRSGDENGYRVAAGLRTTESGVAPTR
jgi:hypothetical protein